MTKRKKTISFRIDALEVEKLDSLCRKKNKDRSEFIRKAIKKKYKKQGMKIIRTSGRMYHLTLKKI